MSIHSEATAIPEQIATQAKRSPDAVALECNGETMSYRQLNRKADQLAAHLSRHGDVNAAVIPVLLERSFDYVIAALGIMRAGAAYLPLDLNWPESRLRFAIEDSGAPALITSAALFQRLGCDLPYVDPSRDLDALLVAHAPATNILETEQLAYLIYTSGSTGLPKGVEITHGNLSHLVSWHQTAFSITERDRASHLAGLGFDAAVWEIWPYLCTGSTVCLPHDSVRFSPESIWQWLLQAKITIAFVPTVHATALLSMTWPEQTPLRCLLTGGDTLSRFPRHSLPFIVVNNYGPTECTVVATSYVLPIASSGTPSIGVPIAGAHIYLLDEHLAPVSAGSVGEIYIGGGGVGRGYRNLPEKTSSAFLRDPFTATVGARMYKSGDLGVLLPSGEIEFHGRVDRQVKLRGYRIELDEIGRRLFAHPAIAYATAALDTSQAGEPALVAYVLTSAKGTHVTAGELHQFLAADLPQYMIPAKFARLESLPLSTNGKIDLKLLPAFSELHELPSLSAEIPLNELQQTLLTLMRNILESQSLTAGDNFFLAGGHSLLGMQLVLRIREHLNINLHIRQLFEAPTVMQLAALISTTRSQIQLQEIWRDILGKAPESLDEDFFGLGGDLKQIATLQRRIAESGPEFPVELLVERSTIRSQAALLHNSDEVHSALPIGVLPLRPHGSRQQMFWIHYPNPEFARAFDEEQPFFSLVLTESDVRSLGPEPRLEALAGCFLQKLLAMKPTGPIFVGGFCIGGILAFEVARQLQLAHIEVAMLVLLDTPYPRYFNPGERPGVSMQRAQYVLKRAARIGARASLAKARERFNKRFYGREASINSDAGVDMVQQLVERAATLYEAGSYGGRTLLVLAADHSPDVNFEPGWRTLIPHDLRVEYVNHHHTELMNARNVFSVATAITPHLQPEAGKLRAQHLQSAS